MIDPLLLGDLFAETYALLRRHTAGLTHADSLRRPPFRASSVNWVVSHIVATRVNILVGLLDVPNRWDMSMLMRFIPEAPSTDDEMGAWRFEQILQELERTQEHLGMILNGITAETLQTIKGEQTLVAHLISYHAHEAYHAGQLDILCQLARAGLGRNLEDGHSSASKPLS